MKHEVITVGDAAVLASRAAALVAERGRRAIEAGGRFTFAVSGGKTPWAMFAELAGVVGPDFDWASVQVFQVDERVAPDGDPDRNLTHLRESLRGVPAEIVPMPVNDDDLDAAALARTRPGCRTASTWSTSGSAPTATLRPWSRGIPCSRSPTGWWA